MSCEDLLYLIDESERPCLPEVVIPDSEVVRREGVVGGHQDGFEVRMSGESLTGMLTGWDCWC